VQPRTAISQAYFKNSGSTEVGRLMEIYIDRTGNASCIYDEAINLSAIGAVSIRRASHVEPGRTGRVAGGHGDSRRSQAGPVYRRSEALASEEQYILSHLAGSYIRRIGLGTDQSNIPDPPLVRLQTRGAGLKAGLILLGLRE